MVKLSSSVEPQMAKMTTQRTRGSGRQTPHAKSKMTPSPPNPPNPPKPPLSPCTQAQRGRLPLAGKPRQEPAPGSNCGLGWARRESATTQSSAQGALAAIRRGGALDCVSICTNRRGLHKSRQGPRKSRQGLPLAAVANQSIRHEAACKSRQGSLATARRNGAAGRNGLGFVDDTLVAVVPEAVLIDNRSENGSIRNGDVGLVVVGPGIEKS